MTRAAKRFSIENESIVTYHLSSKDVIIKLETKNAIMFPIQDIAVQKPIYCPSFLIFQYLLISDNIICHVAKCENPYPIIEITIISLNRIILYPFYILDLI